MNHDNPFARGVSINNGIPMMDDEAMEENTKRILKQFWPDSEKGSVSINQDIVMEDNTAEKKQRATKSRSSEWRKHLDKWSLVSSIARREANKRQLLALGREEE